jgi:gas vesicle protein GvpL/GvpF
MRRAAIFPVPFGTLYRDLDSLAALIRAHRGVLRRFFREVAGCGEWEVRLGLRLAAPQALEAVAGDLWPDWAGLPPGTRYLRMCRERPRLLAAAGLRAEGIAVGFADRLRPLGTALRRLPSPAPDAAAGEFRARFALLVATAAADRLGGQVRRIADEAAGCGAAVALSGPWPPFSFRPDLPAVA